jgi:hypothetical protein
MRDYTVIPLNAESILHLYTLHERVYGKACPAGYFHKKYNTAYTGTGFIGFIALYNTEPVAYYGVIPMFVSIRNSPVLAAQSCDTMTHPAHRKKGLFTELAMHTFALAKEQGIHFIFGFPNQHSYPGFIKKLGFAHAEMMNRYLFRFPDPLYKKIYRKFLGQPIRSNTTAFENTLLNGGHDGMIYSAGFLNYKQYNSNVLLSVEKNHTAWVHQNGDVWLGAIAPAEKEVLENCLDTLQKQTRAKSVMLMVSPGTKPDSLLQLLAAPQPGFAVITKNLSNTYPLDRLKFQLADIDIF